VPELKPLLFLKSSFIASLFRLRSAVAEPRYGPQNLK
jgi:hypothetical protein